MTERLIVIVGQSNPRGILGEEANLPNGAFVKAYHLDGTSTTGSPATQNDGSPFITPTLPIYNEDGPHNALGLYIANDLVPDLVPTYDFVSSLGCAKGGTTSTQWVVSESTSTLYGAMLASIAATGQEPAALIIYQGESNAPSPALAAQWLPDWQANADDFQARFNNAPVLAYILPANNPNAGFFVAWNQTRAGQMAFADVTKRRYAVQAPNTAPGQLHQDTAGLIACGALAPPILAPLLLNKATISTIEYSLNNNSTTIAELSIPGVYTLALDASSMQAGDVFGIFSREKATLSSAQKKTLIATIAGKQSAPIFTATVPMLDGWDLTMQKIAGLDRVFQWQIRTLWLGN